MLASGSAQY